jgi:outer membrane protein assembly factor BamB
MWAAPVATTFTGPSGTAVAISPPLGYTTYDQDITGNDIVLLSVPGISGTYSGGLTSWQPGWDIEAGYSLTTGAQLWIVNRTQVPDTRLGEWPCFNNGEYIMENFEMMSISAFSSSTGKQLWGPVYLNDTGDEWGNYQNYPLMAYGIVFVADLGGYVYAVNATTGARLWTWNTGSGTYATPYNVFPLWSMALIAGNELFVFGGHEYSPPLFPGGQLYCININTGKLTWSILNFPVSNGPTTAIADGILTLPDAYDSQIYAFGQGPSQTTVTAPQVGATTSTPVTITGSVMDISAGSQQEAVKANFPNGLPCVSDASMSQFMEAVYQQQPMPSNVTGVSVTINVLDSNGNYRTIGTATTNAQGFYSLTWTPDITGNFTVTAIFAGTGAYYGSSATTAFYASATAPTPAPTATPLAGLASNNTVMYGIVAIIVVIIIIGAILVMLMLRKRP